MASDALQKAQLAAMLTAYVASLTTPTVGLFTNAGPVGPNTNFAGLTQPTQSWYTPKTLTYGRAFENTDGSITIRGGSLQFNYTGTDASCVINGWLVWGTPATPIVPVSCATLAVGVNMATTLDSVIVEPSITLPPVNQS